MRGGILRCLTGVSVTNNRVAGHNNGDCPKHRQGGRLQSRELRFKELWRHEVVVSAGLKPVSEHLSGGLEKDLRQMISVESYAYRMICSDQLRGHNKSDEGT